MNTIWNRRSSDAVLRRGFCFCTGRGSGHSAAPATYFSAASEETIFSAAVHIDVYKRQLAAYPLPAEGFVSMEIRGDRLTDKENAGAALLDTCKEVKGKDPER